MLSTPLFPDLEITSKQRVKQPRLGRYQNVQRNLLDDEDTRRIFVDVLQPENPCETLRFIDLFSGAGGMTLGLQQAGLTPIASVEINPFASATHRRNFPNCLHFEGDIAIYEPPKVLANSCIHVVSGGPPCQGFSVAGRRDPDDPRNILFRQFVRVVERVQPWFVVMENVPGIITMKKGEVKEAILEAFAEIGYPEMSVAILESAQYGVPQIRPRAIFIANRLGLPNPFPKPQLAQNEYVSIESAISDLSDYPMTAGINHEWTRHSSAFMERIAQVQPGHSLYESYADAFKRQHMGVPSMTVKENHGGTHIHPFLNRVISAREMARLQTFPDDFIFSGSMKKAMWQIGNAVPPMLAQRIGQALIPQLNSLTALKN
jgi:DNA (cytosine-5)-methyltransferase 1